MSPLNDDELRHALEQRRLASELSDREREQLRREISLSIASVPSRPGLSSLLLSRRLPVAALVGSVAVVAALVLLRPSLPDITSGQPSSEPSNVATAPQPAPSATTGGTPVSSLAPARPTPDADSASLPWARAVLDRWEQAVNSAPDGSIAFTGFVSYGGGWRGRDADDQKSAFLSGRIEASVQLPTDIPPPRDVAWDDGARATVPLISAADAFDELRRGLVGGGCPECRPLEVVAARLITRGAETSRGWADVPAWEFTFTRRDSPIVPVTHVAVRDRIDVRPREDVPHFLSYALGTPTSTSLTVGFSDSACGPEDFTAEAVESELGVVVLVQPDPPPDPDATPRICIAMAVGRTADVELEAPLGSRTVLDPVSGQPIPVYPELPEDGFPRP